MRGLRRVLFILVALLIATGAEARRSYVIQPGDVPGEIAGKFAPTLEELRAANPGVNFDTLVVGKQVQNPYPEPAELTRLMGELARLKVELVDVAAERDLRARELAASRELNTTLDAKVAELTPLARQAEKYRDRFRGWVGGFAGAFVLALLVIVRARRVHGRLDRKIISLQQDVARARIDGVMSAAAPRSQGASASRRANGADTTAHPH